MLPNLDQIYRLPTSVPQTAKIIGKYHQTQLCLCCCCLGVWGTTTLKQLVFSSHYVILGIKLRSLDLKTNVFTLKTPSHHF